MRVGIVFFFQAEDGIRARTVTGVQTCALPIYPVSEEIELGVRGVFPESDRVLAGEPDRSEERRVGKECRSRWSPDHLKKKKDKFIYSCVGWFFCVGFMLSCCVLGCD